MIRINENLIGIQYYSYNYSLPKSSGLWYDVPG